MLGDIMTETELVELDITSIKGAVMSKRYLSGIQPSGVPHLGNYFGAIKEHVRQSKSLEEGDSALFFIADYHALTSFNVFSELGMQTRAVAATYMALGLDTKQAVFFEQSAVPEVCELNWILACCTGMGALQRAHSYKDKVAQGLVPNVGLFTYPVLMAADILIYQSTHIPVGKDQTQHVEMAQDMAGSFNALMGAGEKVLQYPIPVMGSVPSVPGTDGRKMSKSYGNTIDIFASGKKLNTVVKSIVTDSRSPDDPKDPDSIPLFGLLRCFMPTKDGDDLAAIIRAGGRGAPGYGALKALLLDYMDATFCEARGRYEVLMNTEAGQKEVADALNSGAEKARGLARETLSRCYEGIGLTNAALRCRLTNTY